MGKQVVVLTENGGKMFEEGNKEGIRDYEQGSNSVEKYEGTFRHVGSVKGIINGHEEGIFVADNGLEFIVFNDKSVVEYK